MVFRLTLRGDDLSILSGRHKLLQKQVHIVKKALYWFLNTSYTQKPNRNESETFK